MRSLLGVLLAWALALDAHAAELYVDVRGVAAVTPGELAEAVAARATLARERGGGVQVVTVVLEPDLAVVIADGRVQRVALGGRSGRAAARVVAIGVTDLVARLPAAPAPRERGVTVTAWPAFLLGTAARQPSALGIAADVSAPLGGWRVGLTAELSRGFTVEEGGRTFGLLGIALRAGAGRRLGPLELRVGPTATIDLATGGEGHSGVRLGAAATALWAFELGGSLSLVLAAGVDAYARRTTYTAVSAPVLETPRLRPWGGVGLAWGWGR